MGRSLTYLMDFLKGQKLNPVVAGLGGTGGFGLTGGGAKGPGKAIGFTSS
jgi:hypothetical protein